MSEEGPWVQLGDVEVGPLSVREADGTVRPTESLAEIATARMIREQIKDRALDALDWDLGE